MKAKKLPWLKFFVADWKADSQLKMCSAAARGVWIELICLMHEATPYGHLLVHGQPPNEAQLASLTGIPVAVLSDGIAELELRGVYSRTREGVIYSRKLVRMESTSAKSRKNGKLGGNPTLRKQKKKAPELNPPVKAGLKPKRPEARGQREDPDNKSSGSSRRGSAAREGPPRSRAAGDVRATPDEVLVAKAAAIKQQLMHGVTENDIGNCLVRGLVTRPEAAAASGDRMWLTVQIPGVPTESTPHTSLNGGSHGSD